METRLIALHGMNSMERGEAMRLVPFTCIYVTGRIKRRFPRVVGRRLCVGVYERDPK
jgi:hypothetical protein